jgi:hypothetical protein
VSLILSWAIFPLILAALGAGWGLITERAAGTRVDAALLLPLGLAAVLVVAGTLNAFDLTTPAAVPVVAIVAIAGLPMAWAGRRRLGGWFLLAALGVLFAYGAPVLLSGQATFTGFLRLDDTATWLNIIDQLPSGPPSAGGDVSSTYTLHYNTLVLHYPRGAFTLPEIGHALSGIDVAWAFQPYQACCAAAVALCLYSLVEPLVPSTRIRALIAFLGAQSALLYGYSLWGGVKELTAAFLLTLMAALAATLLRRRPARPRELLPLAVAAGALIQTLGVGAGGWVALAFALLAGSWLLSERGSEKLPANAASIAWLGALTAALMIPVWLTVGDFLSKDAAALFSSGQSEHTRIGNLFHPLSAFQLAGIWPVGDFRLTAPTLPSVLLIGLTLTAAGGAIWASVRRRELGLLLYVAVAVGGCGLIFLSGATPWVVGKTLAIGAPALLAAGLTGAAILWNRHRVGLLLFVALAFGVLWSNALAYHDVLLAPRPRLAELQRIGELVAGKGPTLLNEYEVYGDRHFLREGEPTEPAEYRSATLALRDGTQLTQAAWADLDSLPLPTLEEYPSIVTRRSPAESRPPSNYRLAWRGRYYDLWQRPEDPATSPLAHFPLGESTSSPYCGAAQGAEYRPACSVNPVSTPRCARVRELGWRAGRRRANLVAHLKPAPIVARADQTLWPGRWFYDPAGHTLTANDPGRLVAHIAVASSQRYELWLGGSFARGFEVRVDGRELGRVKDELSSFGGYVHVGDPFLAAGTHTFVLTYPHSDLTPGSGDNSFTSLTAIALQPESPPGRVITVTPDRAEELCVRSLDWIELVAEAG